jgi:hypothetical protein
LVTTRQAGEYRATGEQIVGGLLAERRVASVEIGTFIRLQRSALGFIEAGRVPSE